MRIGIDCRMIKATGIGRYTSNLIEELAKLDSENEYILFFKKEEFKSFKVPAKNFKKVLADFHWYGFSEQCKFPALLKSQNLDLMHFPHFNTPLFYRKKFIVSIHDLTLHRYKTVEASTKNILIYQLKHFFYKVIIKNAIKRSLKVLALSKFTEEDIISNFKVPKEKIALVYPGAPSRDLVFKKTNSRILEKLKIKSPFVLYVGNAYPHKNLENLIYSLKFLPSDITLVLVGKIDDFYKRIKNQVFSLGFKKRVIFTGFLTDEELASLYKRAQVFAFPSLNEGFGLPALESMSFGLPVVSSNLSCLPEILGGSARYFNPLKPKDIAEKIKEILGNKKLREELILKGYNKIKEYSWSKMAKEILKVYKEVLKDG